MNWAQIEQDILSKQNVEKALLKEREREKENAGISRKKLRKGEAEELKERVDTRSMILGRDHNFSGLREKERKKSFQFSPKVTFNKTFDFFFHSFKISATIRHHQK